MRKSVAPAITKNCRDVLAIFSGISSSHDAFVEITFASVKDATVVGRMFLDAGAPIETCVVVSPACDVFDLALQSGVSFGTGAVHSIVVQFLFERKLFGLIDPGVGSEFAMPVPTDALVVTKEITPPIVSVHNSTISRRYTNGKDE